MRWAQTREKIVRNNYDWPSPHATVIASLCFVLALIHKHMIFQLSGVVRGAWSTAAMTMVVA